MALFRGLFLWGSRQVLLVASESISSPHFPSALASVLITKVKSVWFSHSACCISSTQSETFTGWEVFGEFLNTIIDFTLIFLMNQGKLLCRAVTAKKYLTSCLNSIAWKKPDRSINLFSQYFSISFKHIFTDFYYPSWSIQHKSNHILPAAEVATSWISATRDMDILLKAGFFLAFHEAWLEHNHFASAPVHTNTMASVLGHQTCKKGRFFYICKLLYLLHQFILHSATVLLDTDYWLLFSE